MTRDKAKTLLDNLIGMVEDNQASDYDEALRMAISALEQEPPKYWIDYYGHVTPLVQPSRKGHWIEKEDFNGDTYYDCSECGESFCLMEGTPTDNLYNYCPNCGCRMVGDTE